MAQWSSPPGTGATNEIKVFTGLGKAGERWLTIGFTFHVLFNHQPVHNFPDDKQFGKSPDTASICPADIG